VVVQNIFTSLFNSHLFDFHEGWVYPNRADQAGCRACQPVATAMIVAAARRSVSATLGCQ
jgi:hypothetical protein